MNRLVLFFTTLVFVLFSLVNNIQAKADLSLTVPDITFSGETALVGEKTRVFARVFNLGDEDVYGFVVFSINGKAVGEPQAISVKVNAYDDVFIDWIFEKGNHNIGAGIIGTQPQDENAGNNLVLQNDYFVDSDADRDGIGDAADDDNDNDSISNADEMILGTDALKADTDNDGLDDKNDAFPLDKIEWQDIDRDGLGDNLDADDDNDGLTDQEELALGADPLKTDTDGDLIPDKTERGIIFLNPNRNEWQVASNHLVSAADAVKTAVEQGNAAIGYLFAAFGFLSVVLLATRFLQKN